MPIYYIAPDLSKVIGLDGAYQQLHIITGDDTETARLMQQRGVSVYVVGQHQVGYQPGSSSSRSLLLDGGVQQHILSTSESEIGVLFFKPTFDPQLILATTLVGSHRTVCLLQSSAALINELENKRHFWQLAQNKHWPIPKARWTTLSVISYDELFDEFGDQCVIQFEQGWAGRRTFFISNPEDLFKLQKLYDDNPIKVTSFIDGPTLTINAVVTDTNIFYTQPFVQLSGDIGVVNDFASSAGMTVGNFIGDPEDIGFAYPVSVYERIVELTELVGMELRNMDFLGYFGLDFLIDETEVYLQELNPRFTASVSFIDQLQRSNHESLLDRHLEAFNVDPQTVNSSETMLSGIRIVARNSTAHDLVVSVQWRNGIYFLKGNELERDRAGYRLDELGDGEMLIFTAPKGTVLQKDDELLQIQTKSVSLKEIVYAAKKIKTFLTNSST